MTQTNEHVNSGILDIADDESQTRMEKDDPDLFINRNHSMLICKRTCGLITFNAPILMYHDDRMTWLQKYLFSKQENIKHKFFQHKGFGPDFQDIVEGIRINISRNNISNLDELDNFYNGMLDEMKRKVPLLSNTFH